ncbi:MAG: RNA polymerase sigma factor [Sneathiella sp.]|nr:RNA polymerase sigma factor [Sneathiella sp.]
MERVPSWHPFVDDLKKTEIKILGLLPLLRRYARSLSQNEADAEDLLQDCLEAAFASQDGWRGSNLKSWLMTIMTNKNRNRHRRNRNAPPTVDIDTANEITAPPSERDPLERDILESAVDLLSEDSRAVLMLIVVEGYSYAEVSEMLQIPIGTVMSRLSRARKKMTETLQGHNIVPLRRQS